MIFKFANHRTKEFFVSTANKPLVGTLMTIGDVTVSIAISAARTLVELRVVVFKTTIGSLSKDDVDDSENVI